MHHLLYTMATVCALYRNSDKFYSMQFSSIKKLFSAFTIACTTSKNRIASRERIPILFKH